MFQGRPFVLVGACLVAMAGVALFQLKHTIETRELLVAKVHKQYLEDQAAVRVMRAEWAYLNSPDYLQRLVQKHLRLGPIHPDQILEGANALPLRGVGRVPIEYSSAVISPPDAVEGARVTETGALMSPPRARLRPVADTERD